MRGFRRLGKKRCGGRVREVSAAGRPMPKSRRRGRLRDVIDAREPVAPDDDEGLDAIQLAARANAPERARSNPLDRSSSRRASRRPEHASPLTLSVRIHRRRRTHDPSPGTKAIRCQRVCKAHRIPWRSVRSGLAGAARVSTSPLWRPRHGLRPTAHTRRLHASPAGALWSSDRQTSRRASGSETC